MKDLVQRASSVANVELTHNKISVNEDAEMAFGAHLRSILQTRALAVVASDLSHTAGHTVKWQTSVGGHLLQMREDSECWDSELHLLEIHPKKMIESCAQRYVQKNVPCAERDRGGGRGRSGERNLSKAPASGEQLTKLCSIH